MALFFTDKEFTNKDYTKIFLPKGEYDTCTFINCNFADSDLSLITFLDCEFIDCNLSNAKLNGVSLNEVQFTSCKLLGLNFSNCNDFLFHVNFDNCQLNFASFYQLKIIAKTFRDCSLLEVDFTQTNLTQTVFDNCDLNQAIFEQSNLEKTDFRTAKYFSINPELNRMSKAKFLKNNLEGLLGKYGLDVE